jgi:hypothetical protein
MIAEAMVVGKSSRLVCLTNGMYSGIQFPPMRMRMLMIWTEGQRSGLVWSYKLDGRCRGDVDDVILDPQQTS